MKISNVSNAQRLGVALCLQGAWGGAEDDVASLLAIHEAFGLEAYKDCFVQTQQGMSLQFVDEKSAKNLTSEKVTQDVSISPDQVRFLLKIYSPSPTPAKLGPAKAVLLRTLRAAVGPDVTEEEAVAVTPSEKPSKSKKAD